MAFPQAAIFDFGGVVIESRENLIYPVYARLFDVPVEQIRGAMGRYTAPLQRGQMDELSFWQAIKGDLKRPDVITTGILSEMYEKNLVPYPAVQTYILELRARGIVTAMITNTEEPHARINKKLHLYDPFNPAVLSYEVGMRKPDLEIYEYALRLLGLSGDQCVYVDDLAENLPPAAQLGMQTIHCTGPEQLLGELKKQFGE